MQSTLIQKTRLLVSKSFKNLSSPQKNMLADMMSAFFYNESFSLREIASKLSGEKNVKHKLKKLQNFLDGLKMDDEFWRSYIKLLFSLPYFRFKQHRVISLILDATTLRDDYWMLALSVGYKGRAIPITLLAWRGVNRSYDYWERVRTLMSLAQRILPNRQYEIVADRGFDGKTLIEICQELKWDYVIRVNDQYRVKMGNKEYIQLSLFEDGYYEQMVLGKKHPIKTHLTIQSVADDSGQRLPWYLVHSRSKGAGDTYARRFWIEESFKDLKGTLKWEKYYRRKIPANDRMIKSVVISCLSYALQLCIGSNIDVPPSEEKKTSVLKRLRHIVHSNWSKVDQIYRKIISIFRSNFCRNFALFDKYG